MLFNSIEFALFLPIVFILYWFVFYKSLRIQNTLLLCASYVFYAWWDYRFLALIFLSTLVDFIIGKLLFGLAKENRKSRNFWVSLSVIFNLGLLVFFKYYNFFIDSWVQAFSSIGYQMDRWTLNVILPVGISFYTFQTMSYTLDIYKGKLKPTNDFLGFATFVSFFPQLVAGPIERASNLLPQILSKRKFDYNMGVKGLRLILWGLVKKVVFADSLAPVVNDIFLNYEQYSSTTLILGGVYFGIQIYCDFSGYSDIARGVSRLLGIELMVNFNFPYFSQSIAEFWRKWHISLSTWFRDYVYIPLGGSKVSQCKAIRNIFIVFLVSGLWHGANWTFVFWGAIHALIFLPAFLLRKNQPRHLPLFEQRLLSKGMIISVFKISLTFSIVTLAWIFFRAENINHAFNYLGRIANFNFDMYKVGFVYLYVLPLFFLEIIVIKRWFFQIKSQFIRLMVYVVSFLVIIRFSVINGSADFIYFQF